MNTSVTSATYKTIILIFKLWTEAYTSTLSVLTDWLTDWLTNWLSCWLICTHDAPTNLTNVEKSYSYKVSGSKSPGQRSLEATTWEFIRRIFGWQQQQKVKNHYLFTSISVRTWWKSPTRWEKKIRTRSYSRDLTRAVLLWFQLSSSSVIQICPF